VASIEREIGGRCVRYAYEASDEAAAVAGLKAVMDADGERDRLEAELANARDALALAECARDELKAKLALRDSKCALSTCEKHGIHQPFGVGTKGCFSFCDEHAQAFRAEWVVKEKLADAEQRIAELEARDKLKAEEYDTRIVLAAQFERANREALEDARAARRERDEAVRELAKAKAKLAKAVPERRWYGEVSWGWCPDWSSCTPLYTTREAAETCLRERVAGPDDVKYEMRVRECNVVKTYPVEKGGA